MTDLAGRARRMVDAAHAFLESLGEAQRRRACLDFADAAQRSDWHYVPRQRPGLPLKDMDGPQRARALELVAAGLSAAAYAKATTIMQLESVLAGIEGPGRRFPRDPELYYITLFAPAGERIGGDVWGWRFEGHHISLNLTVVDDGLSATPLFFGANPAEVRHGEQQGLRTLREEEDLARDLLTQLDGEQRAVAIVAAEAPGDILSTNAVRLGDEVPDTGLAATDMTPGQRQLLAALVQVYAGRQPEPLAAAQGARRERDLAAARFAWAGAVERGGPHYYRVLGPDFLAEYDNTQNDANHIHAVWRDRTGDFGQDLLRRHYQQSH